MAKIKWTEGWLCRDKKNNGGYVMFFGTGQPECRGGLWEGPYCLDESWTPEEFDRIYGLNQAPVYGKKFLCDMEL